MPRRSPEEWFKKYFLEGQALSNTQTEALKNLDQNAPWYTKLIVKHRRWVGILIPFTIVQVIWWSCAIKYNYWALFPDRFYISITMIFGSVISGMTSEGGGAVAFPVMTLAFNISPAIARDFSLMIQSVGMTAATFTIFWMRIQLEWRSIIFCSSGAVLGMIIGLEFIDPNLTPPQKKMGFVSIWFAFAFALFLLNRYHKRKTFRIIPEFNTWKAGVLLLTGFLGGIFSAVAGSGVDICSFSILTLLFRVSEKTATPTSVVLMAGNTVVGFYWRQVMMEKILIDSYHYLAVCAPIVVLGAPLGSVIGSHFHRQVLAALIYILDTVALIYWRQAMMKEILIDSYHYLAVCAPIVVLGAPLGSVIGSHFHRQVLAALLYILNIVALISAFAIVKLNPTLIGVSVGIIVFGFVFFGFLSYLGHRLMQSVADDGEKARESSASNAPGVDKTSGNDNEAYVISDEKVNELNVRNNVLAENDKNAKNGITM